MEEFLGYHFIGVSYVVQEVDELMANILITKLIDPNIFYVDPNIFGFMDGEDEIFKVVGL